LAHGEEHCGSSHTRWHSAPRQLLAPHVVHALPKSLRKRRRDLNIAGFGEEEEDEGMKVVPSDNPSRERQRADAIRLGTEMRSESADRVCPLSDTGTCTTIPCETGGMLGFVVSFKTPHARARTNTHTRETHSLHKFTLQFSSLSSKP
jgi:hypothetical protein